MIHLPGLDYQEKLRDLVRVKAVFSSLTLAPCLTKFFGRQTDVSVVEVESLGWVVSVGYEKESVHPSHGPFFYAVEWKIPLGSTVKEAIYAMKSGYEEFVMHEVEEGLTLLGVRVLDPHPGMGGATL